MLRLLPASLVLLLWLGGGRPLLGQGSASGGLAVTLVRDVLDLPGGESPRFRLRLHNATTGGMVLEIGTMAGNGRQQFLDGFRYLLRMPDGRREELTVEEPSLLGQPRPEALAVPLAPNGTLDLPVNLATMLLERGDRAHWRVHLMPGTYSFEVVYRHMMPATGVHGAGVLPPPMVPYWVGEVRTTPVTFVIRR